MRIQLSDHADVGEASRSTFEKLKRYVPGGVNSPFRGFDAVGGTPPVMARGEGAWLWDVDDRRYLDLLGAWGPLMLGHAHPYLKAAAHAAVEDGSVFGMSTKWELELAQRLVKTFPSMEMVRLVNSGTEAVMTSVRLARGFTGRTLIVRFEGAYHGHVDSLLEAVGTEAPPDLTLAKAGIPPGVAQDTLTLPYNDVAALRDHFARRGTETAAVILEPITGSMGVVVAEAAFRATLRELTGHYGSVLIFDEVITGLRVARGGAQERLGVNADLTVLGKALSGGFAIGAVGGRRDIMSCLSPLGAVYQAGTYSGNPLSTRCAIATLDALGEAGLYDGLEHRGIDLAEGLRRVAAEHGIPLWVSQFGCMLGLLFLEGPVLNYREAVQADTEKYQRFFHGMLQRGILLPTSTFDAICLSTAYTSRHTDIVLSSAAETFSTW
ncbi:MAG TPA: glutamate-1-semialdehyde 2,1-aminomutase [Candidatus Xenobia bacterium]|jgi:glutamate-1-semialdehyde 2,1-aminomutase